MWENPPELPHHFNVELFREYLADHPQGDVNILYITDGYPLWLNSRDPKKLSKQVFNICRDKRDLYEILLRMVKEARSGKIKPASKQGHYQLNLLCVPKKDAETGYMTNVRVARHGSYATRHKLPINKDIDKEHCKMENLPNTRKYIHRLIKWGYVSLRDLKDAFRQLLLASKDIGWVQYCLFGLPFWDQRQAYGLASAAANCQHFGNLLIWIYHNKYLPAHMRDRVLVHIDDFLIASKSEKEAIFMAGRFDQMCEDLGVKVSHEKDETAIVQGIVHGMGFNLETKFVEIPKLKFDELITGIDLMVKHRWVQGKALESMCGKMMHWSQLRKQAKVLCYRLLGFIYEKIRKNPRYKWCLFWLPDVVVRDLLFWKQYAWYMRKVSMVSVLQQPSITISGSSDASSFAGGFVVGGHYGSYLFNNESNESGLIHLNMHINLQEAHAVIMLLYNFRKLLTGHQLLLYIDNEPLMYSVFRNWSGSGQLMEFVQEISLLMCVYCIGIRVEYIPSELNGFSDALSRCDYQRFRDLAKADHVSFDEQPTLLEYYSDLPLLKTTKK